MKRVIVNGLTGSSWRFKRFNRIAINVKNKKLKSARICKMDFIQLFAGVDENDDDLNEDEEQFAGNQNDVSLDKNFYRKFENLNRNLHKPVDDY